MPEFRNDPAEYLQTLRLTSDRVAAQEQFQERLDGLSAGTISQGERDKFAADMVHSHVGFAGKLRVTAYREDWLHLEEQAIEALKGLMYAAILVSPDSNLSRQGDCLFHLADQVARPNLLQSILRPESSESFAKDVVDFVVATVDWAQDRFEGKYAANWLEGGVRRASKTAPSPDPEGIEKRRTALSRLEAEIRRMPGHVGTLLTGSFAIEAFRDSFADLDVFAVFDELPTDRDRDEMLGRLGLERDSRHGPFEYLKPNGVDVHMMVFASNQIGQALAEFEATGEQETTIDFSTDEAIGKYTPPAHRWIRGDILSDSEDVLKAFKRRSRSYPVQLKQRIVSTWARRFARYREALASAISGRDELSIRFCFPVCIEAAYRTLLSKNHVHQEETTTKWLARELPLLSEDIEGLEKVLDVVPSRIQEDPDLRLEKVDQIWAFANKSGGGV